MPKSKTMDIVKFKYPKTIKIEVHNTNNVFDFNKAVEMEARDQDILLKLYNALEMLFKKKKKNSSEIIFPVKRVYSTRLMRLELE
jgi:hypothetical protein